MVRFQQYSKKGNNAMANIFDVARYAGVSKSTVSLVLNKSPNVKDETKEKVLRAIEALDYTPNNNARGLSSKTTKCLGIVVITEGQMSDSYDFDQHTGLYTHNISAGILQALDESGYGVIMEYFSSHDKPGELPDMVKTRRVDGIFIIGSNYDMGLLNKLSEMNFPYVVVGVGGIDGDYDSVTSDLPEGIGICIRHVWECGHRDIAYLNSPRYYQSSYVREAAFYRNAAELHVDVKSGWFIIAESNTGLGGYNAFKSFWEAGNRPTAVITANAQLAIGMIRYLNEIGIRVPEDISVMGYEDSALAGYSNPPLTTVNIHKEEMGAKAAKCLLQRLRHPDAETMKLVVKPDLVVRESVKKI